MNTILNNVKESEVDIKMEAIEEKAIEQSHLQGSSDCSPLNITDVKKEIDLTPTSTNQGYTVNIFNIGSRSVNKAVNDSGSGNELSEAPITPIAKNFSHFINPMNQNGTSSSNSLTNGLKIRVGGYNNDNSPKKMSNNRISNISADDHTLDYSSLDDDRSVSGYSPSKILRKYNLSPYHNFSLVKKFFIYQLKKSFLQAKKFMFNSSVHATDQNKSPAYYEIFANYSQIASNNVHTYVVYDDNNIKINNFFIYKNKVLGKGGFSSVYYAKNLKDKKEYAVKITDKKVRANARKTKYDYVREEVNILKRLYSKYVVKTYEFLETKNECMIIMEYMKNNSLFSKISKLDTFQIWKYFRNLICAVEHCHEIGKIVHRDINVNNLLISDDDTLKLSDFGVSVIVTDDDDLIPCSLGPTTYTPPEKKNIENIHYSGKSADIWCCGVTLYHMVYKRPLFSSKHNGREQEVFK
jgi:tRNA A-37 threonylcarbamoyl transferase component Bud32